MSSRSSRSSRSSSSSASSSSSLPSSTIGATRFVTPTLNSEGLRETYLRIPKRESFAVGILAYAAGAPRNSSLIKKLTRPSEAQRMGGYVPSSDSQLFWVPNEVEYCQSSSSSSRRRRRTRYPVGVGPPHPGFGPPGTQFMPATHRVPPGGIPAAAAAARAQAAPPPRPTPPNVQRPMPMPMPVPAGGMAGQVPLNGMPPGGLHPPGMPMPPAGGA